MIRKKPSLSSSPTDNERNDRKMLTQKMQRGVPTFTLNLKDNIKPAISIRNNFTDSAQQKQPMLRTDSIKGTAARIYNFLTN